MYEQKKVEDFHKHFGVTINKKPQFPSETDMMLRISLIEEELNELKDATQRKSLIDIADALGDLLYVVYGSFVTYGIDSEKVFDEIHRSNMSKLWEDGKPRYRKDGKVLKPDTYSPANLSIYMGDGEDGRGRGNASYTNSIDAKSE